MKIGSVVKYSRPYSSNDVYKNAIGVIESMRMSTIFPGQVVYGVRVISISYPLTHKHLEIFSERVDLIKE